MRKIKAEILIDKNQKEPKIIIVTDIITEDILKLQKRLMSDRRIKCFNERGVQLISQYDIIRVYAENGSVIAETDIGRFNLHERLYEIEQALDDSVFVRISKSEIVNSRKIIKLNVKLSGTVGIELDGGKTSFVSRRFVSKIKNFFGLRGASDEE